MTSTSSAISNRKNAQKSTGPVTPQGKAKVSANAMTHGAKAKNFINTDEEQAYQLFLKQLKTQYPSSNPLVDMQLDRIAKFKIQADRIQQCIDATFAASEIEEASSEVLMDLLELDKDQKRIAEDLGTGDLNIKELLNPDRIRVATELAAFDPSTFKSQDDFLFHTPLFCQLLLNEANEYNEEIDDYIEDHAELFTSIQGTTKEIFKVMIKIGNRNKPEEKIEFSDLSNDLPPKPTLENKIQNVKLKNLQKAAVIFGNEINRLGDIHYKALAFNQLKQFKRKPMAINYEQLDKLQRYQTSIQGQLSRMVGELLALVK